ncbi:MAG: tetratricopeptide repeat protein [Chitinophagaceae bacterium]
MKTLIYILSLCLLCLSVLGQHADSAQFYLNKGVHFKEEKRWQQARLSLEKAAHFDTANKEVLLAMGELALLTNNHYQAIEAFSKLNVLQPNDANVIRRLAELFFNAGRYEDAISFGERWEAKHPNEPLHYLMGMSYYHQSNYPIAVNRLLYAADAETASPYLFYTIGRAYVEMERYEKAVPYYKKAADLDTANARYLYELALVYYAIPNDLLAIKSFEEAAARGWKQDADYDENLGYCYLNVKKYSEAIVLFKRSLQKKPYQPSLQFVLAETYYRSGNYASAIEEWDRLLQINKRDAKALYMIGMSYIKMGQKEKGTTLCDQAITIDPTLSSLRQKKINMGL